MVCYERNPVHPLGRHHIYRRVSTLFIKSSCGAGVSGLFCPGSCWGDDCTVSRMDVGLWSVDYNTNRADDLVVARIAEEEVPIMLDDMDERGMAPIVVIIIMITSVLGMIFIYSYLTEPMHDVSDTVENRMPAAVPDGPIDRFWTVWWMVPVAIIIVIAIWVVMKLLMNEPESQYYGRRR